MLEQARHGLFVARLCCTYALAALPLPDALGVMEGAGASGRRFHMREGEFVCKTTQDERLLAHRIDHSFLVHEPLRDVMMTDSYHSIWAPSILSSLCRFPSVLLIQSSLSALPAPFSLPHALADTTESFPGDSDIADAHAAQRPSHAPLPDSSRFPHPHDPSSLAFSTVRPGRNTAEFEHASPDVSLAGDITSLGARRPLHSHAGLDPGAPPPFPPSESGIVNNSPWSADITSNWRVHAASPTPPGMVVSVTAACEGVPRVRVCLV